MSNYVNDPERLGQCVTKANGAYQLTRIGERALETDWERVDELLAGA